MSNLSFEYKKVFGVFPNEEGKRILRIPRMFWMNKMTVSRFIVACLPRLSKVLFAHKSKDGAKIISVLQKSKIDTEEASDEMNRTRKESTLFDRSAKDYRVSQQMYAIYKDGIAHSNQTLSASGIKRVRAR